MGFLNAELLQETDWEKVKIDPRRAQPKHPKWVWAHDPEVYTYENYDRNVEAMKRGIRFDDACSMDDPGKMKPNFPPGYRFEPWNIDDIMDGMYKGEPVELGPGNWD